MQLSNRSEALVTGVGPLELRWRDDGQLWLRGGDAGDCPVKVVRCFPWSEPGHYLSLRDSDDVERGFVLDPEELEQPSRDALARALAEAGFLFKIESISSVVEEIEIRVWTVMTRQGQRTFETARDRWPRELPGGGYLIRDVAGDLYFTPDPDTMDNRSRRYLWAFVD